MFDKNWNDLLTTDFEKLTEVFTKPSFQTEKLKEGERRVVSILFADVMGFTSLSEKLDSEQVYTILDNTLKIFTNSIEKYSGYVDKYEGDCVFALFGAKNATEGDTERAISAGLEMLSKLEQINAFLQKNPNLQNVSLGVRIGIHAGLVTTGKIEKENNFTVFGDSIELTKKLETNAPVGKILLTAETKKLVEDEFEFEKFNKISVKEKAFDCYTVAGFSKNFGKKWQRILSANRTEFIGRKDELELLDTKFELVKNRIGVLENQKTIALGIKGPAGIGKTRFVYEFFKNKFSKTNLQNLTLKGSPHPYLKEPYGIWISVLKKYYKIFEFEEEKTIKSKFSNSSQELLSFIKSEEDKQNFSEALLFLGTLLGIRENTLKIKNLTPEILQSKINFSIKYFVEAVSEKVNSFGFPLTIDLDDLQKMDNSSQNCLDFLVKTLNFDTIKRKEKLKQIFFIFQYRNDYETPKKTFSELDFTELALNSFTKKVSEEFLKMKIGNANLPKSILDDVLEKASGNPFYLEEWTNHLLETVKIKGVNENNELIFNDLEIAIPQNINSLILSRLDRLEQNEKLLLQKGSVIGSNFSGKILEKVEKRFEQNINIGKELKSLISKEWLTETTAETDNYYTFYQLLAQNVTYSTLLLHNRKILHKIIAEILENEFSENYQAIFEHYKKTDILDKKIEFGKKTADKLRKSYENIEAIKIYDELEKICSLQDDLISVLFGKGEAQRDIGKWNEAEISFGKALEIIENLDFENTGKRLFLAQVQNFLAEIFRFKGDYEKSLEFLEKSEKLFQQLRDKKELTVVYANFGNVYNKKGDFELAKEYLAKSLELSKDIGDYFKVAKCYLAIGNNCFFEQDYSQAMEFYQKLLTVSKMISDKKGVSLALGNIGIIFHQLGDYPKAMEFYLEKKKLASELGDKLGIALVNGNIAYLHILSGDFEKALEQSEKNLLLFQELEDKLGIALTFGNIANVMKIQKNFLNAQNYYEKSLKIFTELGAKYYLAEFDFEFAEFYFLTQNFEEAQKFCKEALEISIKSNNHEIIGKAELLRLKINFAQGFEREKQVEEVQKMLEKTTDENEIALLNYEILKMELSLFENDQKTIPERKQKTLSLYKKLFKQTPKIDFKSKIEELEKF
ncbi:tetratricopeptide repeat protein [bacterium]|nr:tetratricopeptide repeat protein [bacterium]